MNERILLSTYAIKIKNKANEYQLLDRFNDRDDFLKIFQNLLDSLYSVIKVEADLENRNSIHLTMSERPFVHKNKRVFYGYFDCGIGGQDLIIREIAKNTAVFRVNRFSHVTTQKVFFYCSIPNQSKDGYLVLQKKAKFGIKIVLSKILKDYIKNLGYMDSRVEINGLLNEKVFDKMFDDGKLKKLEFIKRGIPDDFNEYAKTGQYRTTKGSIKTTFSSGNQLNDTYKKVAKRLFKNPNKNYGTIEIPELNGTFDEVEFEVEFGNKTKTFYVNDRTRTQPDIDVSSEVDFDINGIAETESLAKISQGLIDEMLFLKPIF